jgi:hypothetical protein
MWMPVVFNQDEMSLWLGSLEQSLTKKVAEAQRKYPLRFRFFDLYCLNCHLKLFCPGIDPLPFRLPDFRQLPF